MLSKIRRTTWPVLLIILIGIAAIVAVIFTANNRRFKGEILRDEKITVELTKSNHAEQLTFENELVKVVVGCDQYLAYLDITINDASLPEDLRTDYRELKESIEATRSCNGKGILLHEYSVADMLEHGIASVYDKRNETEVSNVRVWYYDVLCGPLCGSGSRSFYLPDGRMFLYVQDWIS